jgi:hypothetical protein
MPDGACLSRPDIPLGNRSIDRVIREITALQELQHVNFIEHVSGEVGCGGVQICTQQSDGSNLTLIIKCGLTDK